MSKIIKRVVTMGKNTKVHVNVELIEDGIYRCEMSKTRNYSGMDFFDATGKGNTIEEAIKDYMRRAQKLAQRD